MANQLRGKKRDGYSVWLLWDDAEESMRLPWYDPDSLYGVRHLAEKWQEDGTIKKIKAFILEDMIGDADLNIEHDQSSTPWLEDLVYQAATRLGYQSHFFGRTIPIDRRPRALLKARRSFAPISSISTTDTKMSSTIPRKTLSTNSVPRAWRSWVP